MNNNNQLVFKCNITNYYIEYILNDDIAYMYTINCDFVNIKPFLQLIRTSIESLKSKNISKISQTVSLVEWYNFINNNTTFELVNEDEYLEICDIECNIDDFLENLGIILDINNTINI